MRRFSQGRARCATASGCDKCFHSKYAFSKANLAQNLCSRSHLRVVRRCRYVSGAGLLSPSALCTPMRRYASAPTSRVHEASGQQTLVDHTTESKHAQVRAVAETQKARAALIGNFSTLLEDRRACYKDSYVEVQLVGPRMQLTSHLLELWSDVNAANLFRAKLQSATGDAAAGIEGADVLLLRHDHVRSLKADYLSGVQAAAAQGEGAGVRVQALLEFYTALVASSLVESEAQMRMILEEMRATDHVEPTAPVYQSLLCSLLLITREKETASAAAAAKSAQKSTPPQAGDSSCDGTAATTHAASPPSFAKAKAGDIVVGEVKKLNRAEVGDLAGYYMGHALSHHRPGQSHYPAHLLIACKAAATPGTPTLPESAATEAGEGGSGVAVEYVNADLWGTFLSICAMTHVAPKLIDLWWKKFVTFFDAERTAARKSHLLAADARAQSENGTCVPDDLTESFLADLIAAETADAAATADVDADDKSPLPYAGVHAMVSWAAAQRDIERVMRYFHETNKRGVWLPDGTFCPPGCLTLPLAELRRRYPAWQQAQQQQQQAQYKLTEDVLQQLQLRMLAKLMAASKSVKMDGGLREVVSKDVRQLIPLTVLKQAPWGVLSDLLTGLSVPSAMQLLKLAASARPNGDGDVPFFVWASILRRCAHEHLLDQAESLFRFIRARFRLDGKEKRELVEIMMRMYSSLAPPDFSSTLAVFNDHVLRTPKGEAAVAPDAALYTLLIKAADCRETAAMLFLEACSDGVELDADLFEAVLGASQHHVLSQLSRKLPHEYGTSELDAQLRIPHNVDAHARREEALRLRGKTSYSSTGDTGY